MAIKSWLAQKATLMLLLLTWRESVHCNGFTVDPPEDLAILDPGHLGHLEITWSPPASFINMTECPKLYHLEYFNTYSDSWNTVRTSRRTYSALFDLMKDVRVRVYTLLSGPCTNGTMIKSARYTELVQKPPSTGVVGTAVQDFVCVYHNMKYMECNWRKDPNSQQSLYFWHKKLKQADECPKYVFSSGVRSGCNFTGMSLPEFTDITFCVNGSSPEGPLKPTYISLQIQNHVKPDTIEKLHLQTGPDTQLELHWDNPVGRVPGHCLEWKVEHNQQGPNGKNASEVILTKQTSLTLSSIDNNERHCLKVQSKLHKYCADKSFWSEWSPLTCYPVTDVSMVWSFGEKEASSCIEASKKKKEVPPEPEWDLVPVYVYIAVAIIAVLVLSLCAWAVLTVRKSREVKKPDSLLTTLFARYPLFTVAEA